MEYTVNLTDRAQRDLALLYAEIRAESSPAAVNWYRGLKKSILGLERFPNRCASTPERPELRHLLFGRRRHVYRVIYRIVEREKRVDVLHIRHGARDRLIDSDLQ